MADSTDDLAPGDGPAAEPRAATPSVTAVVVAHDPGEWFEQTLDSIVTQDYPRLDIVVVDAFGGENGETLDERVRTVAPRATIVDASDTGGFGAAVNTILETDVGSAFLLVCHDDVRLASDTVRILSPRHSAPTPESPVPSSSTGTAPTDCSMWDCRSISSRRGPT